MNQTTSALKGMLTHCVGRFLIDLPADFEPLPASYAELFYGLDKNFRKVNVEVVRANASQPSFDTIVAKLTAELAAEEHFSSPSKSMLALRESFDANTVLLRAYQDSRMLDYFKSTIVSQKDATVGAFQSEVFAKDRSEDVEARVRKVVELTTYAPKPDSAGRGACLGNMLINAGHDGEVLSVSFRGKKLPDVVIQVDMNSMLASSDGGLLKRWDSKSGMLNKLNFQSATLRRGKVELGAMAGEELLSAGKENGHSVRGFSAETLLLKPATFASPSISVSMSMGGQVAADDYRDASLSDQEALVLWDAVIKSIRPRAGAV